MCSCSTPCWISFYPSWELVYYYQTSVFSFTRGQRYVINLQVTKWPWWSWGMCCWCSGCWYIIIFLTCNKSLDCFSGCVSEFWIPPLIWEPVIHRCWTTMTQTVYLLSQIWQQWFGSTYFPPLVQQPDESTVAPLSNHVHASYRGTSLYRSMIDSGGRIAFCAVLPEHTCTVA